MNLAFVKTNRGFKYIGLVNNLLDIEEVANQTHDIESSYLSIYDNEELFNASDLDDDYQSCEIEPNEVYYVMSLDEAKSRGVLCSSYERRYLLAFIEGFKNFSTEEMDMFKSLRDELSVFAEYINEGKAHVCASNILDYINNDKDASFPLSCLSFDIMGLCDILNDLPDDSCAVDWDSCAMLLEAKLLGEDKRCLTDEYGRTLIIDDFGNYDIEYKD